MRPMRKYAIVEMSSDVPMKCTKMNMNDMRRIEPNRGEYARPQANAVNSRKNESRYVNDGSGLCHVFLVSGSVSIVYESESARLGPRLERTFLPFG